MSGMILFSFNEHTKAYNFIADLVRDLEQVLKVNFIFIWSCGVSNWYYQWIGRYIATKLLLKSNGAIWIYVSIIFINVHKMTYLKKRILLQPTRDRGIVIKHIMRQSGSLPLCLCYICLDRVWSIEPKTSVRCLFTLFVACCVPSKVRKMTNQNPIY